MPATPLLHRMSRPVDVVVVGAGLAGLAAARQLTTAGLAVTVLESTTRTGGRTAGDHHDGFRLDHGSHLLNPSFPELDRSLDLQRLELRPLSPEVLVHQRGRRHRIGAAPRTRGALTSVRAPIGAPWDKARLGAALTRLAATPTEQLLGRPERTAAEALALRRIPGRTVDGFLRPLLAALLSDPHLASSSRVADLVLRGYARGGLSLPAGGIGAVPAQLAEALPAGTVRLGVRVTSVSADGVDTERHGRVPCRAVVVAADSRSAGELLPGLHQPGHHPVTTYYHVAADSPLAAPQLLLDADRGSSLVAHTLVLSEVDRSYAPGGGALISSTVLGRPHFGPDGPAALEPQVRRRLGRLYGVDPSRWEFLTVRHVPDALPAMVPPHHFRRPVRVLHGLYVCGDHRDTSTVQGALLSGRRAAGAVLRDLGLPVAAGAELAA